MPNRDPITWSTMVSGFLHAGQPVEAIDQIILVFQLYQCNMLVADRISSLFHWSLDALARGFRGIATLVLLTYQTEG
jgi:hypothetical protein